MDFDGYLALGLFISEATIGTQRFCGAGIGVVELTSPYAETRLIVRLSAWLIVWLGAWLIICLIPHLAFKVFTKGFSLWFIGICT